MRRPLNGHAGVFAHGSGQLFAVDGTSSDRGTPDRGADRGRNPPEWQGWGAGDLRRLRKTCRRLPPGPPSAAMGCSPDSAYSVDNRHMARLSRLLAAALLVGGVIAASTQPSSAASRPPKLQYQITTLPNGLTVVLSEDHSTPIVHLQLVYHVGLEEREAGPHRVRAPLRAPDVQGLEERAARGAHLDARVGRRPEQRLHDRRRDGVLGDGAGAVPAADPLARGAIGWRRCGSTRTRSPTSATS